MEARTLSFPELVADGLAAVEARMRAGMVAELPAVGTAIDQLLSSGGKRIRPTLVLLSGGLLDADRERTITLGAAAELLHTATLVHDDLIDGSLLRRGFPTLNAQMEDGATVLIGDYIFARAAHLAAETESIPLIKKFATTLAIIVNGELNQLFGSATGDLRQDYFDRVYAKTGSLFELAAESPAMLAGADRDTVRSMKKFGRQLGVAFQIVDDILDFTGNADQVGKPVGGDLRHGLITLPTIYHLESHPADTDQIEALIAGMLDTEEAEHLVETIRRSGAVESALAEASDYIESCISLLDEFPSDRPEHLALTELANYVINRTL
ncbi:MAG: polyprenyl synthetase family protein [Anaerolineales bacterium]